jgi:hypothetical protein
MSIEQADRFLADCVRAVLDDRQAPAWPEGFTSRTQHEIVELRARFHGIAVLLGHAPEVLAGWPAPVADALRAEMRLAALWEELHRQMIAGIIEQLAGQGIAAMVMKGTALAYLYYSEPAARRRGDTDLLIRPEDLAGTRAVLEQAGCYRREDPHGLYYQETWLVDCGAGMVHSIDLHWQPSDRPVLQKILTADRFWHGRQPVARLSPHAAAPDALTMLVHGAVNQAWHVARGYSVEDTRVTGGRRLIWAVDYRKLTRGFSEAQWEALANFCETHDAAAIVHQALGGAQQDIGLAVPARVMERLARAASASPAGAYIADPDVVRDFWRDLGAADSLAVRLRLIRSLAFAPRSHLVEKYPRCAHWPTILLQLRRYSEGLIPGRRPGSAP